MYSLVIINSDQTTALRKRVGDDPTIVVFADSDSLQALERIVAHPPAVVALSRAFVATARGAGLVARLKGEAELSGIDVRILTEDENRIPIVLAEAEGLSGQEAVRQMSRPLDRAGTRGALRYEMDRRPIVVNGEASTLVDLSVTGAQVILPVRVRPNEPVRLVLGEQNDIRCAGKIVWSVAVPVSGNIQYRAGVLLTNPDTQSLEHYCAQFGGRPDHTFGIL